VRVGSLSLRLHWAESRPSMFCFVILIQRYDR
jgi:hypothetical protein